MNNQTNGNVLAIGLELVLKITQLQIFLTCFFAAAIECLLLIQVSKMPFSWAVVYINAFGIPQKKMHKPPNKIKLGNTEQQPGS